MIGHRARRVAYFLLRRGHSRSAALIYILFCSWSLARVPRTLKFECCRLNSSKFLIIGPKILAHEIPSLQGYSLCTVRTSLVSEFYIGNTWLFLSGIAAEEQKKHAQNLQTFSQVVYRRRTDCERCNANFFYNGTADCDEQYLAVNRILCFLIAKGLASPNIKFLGMDFYVNGINKAPQNVMDPLNQDIMSLFEEHDIFKNFIHFKYFISCLRIDLSGNDDLWWVEKTSLIGFAKKISSAWNM